MHFLSPVTSLPIGSETGGASAEEQEDQQILAAWEAIDFGSNFQLSLEDQATKLVDMQENRLNQRKELAQKTKEFKARPADAEHTAELIKLYQKSLDDVTTQAKFSANAFLTVFKILRDLPDPSVSLGRTFERISALRVRIKMLEEREESLTHALKASREKARGADELRAEREKFRENVQLDGDAKLEAERVAAQEKLVQAQAQFDEEMAKLQSQLDVALEEIERHKTSEVFALEKHHLVEESRSRVDSREIYVARSEGYSEAEAMFSARVEEAARSAQELSTRYQAQLDELQATIASQMEQISDLRTELANRPDPATVEKLKTQLAVMTQLTSDNPQTQEIRRSSEKLDGLEAWLLSTNQRLVEDVKQLKEELHRLNEVAKLRVEPPQRVATPLALSTDVSMDDAQTAGALKAQRDRLRAVLEKRDLEIERMQNSLEDKDQKLRRTEDEAEKLRQRVRFLQLYKVSDKSTLLPSANAASVDPEAGTAMLGRGVGHEFRNLWDADSRGASVLRAVGDSYKNRRRDPRGFAFVVYMTVLQLWMLYLFVSGCGIDVVA